MSDQQQQTPPPPSASKLLQQHTKSNTPTMSVEEKVSSNIPFRGFDNGYKKIVPQDTTQHQNTTQPGPVATFFKGLFSPRATDIQQLLIKLQTQVSILCSYVILHMYPSYLSYVYIIICSYLSYVYIIICSLYLLPHHVHILKHQIVI